MKEIAELGIMEYNPPLETNILEWQTAHIDCDAIFSGADLRKAKIYYFAKDKAHNAALYRFMRQNHTDKRLMPGLSREEIGRVD